MIYARLRPNLSIAPALVAAIENPGRDPLAKAIVKELGPHASTVVSKWNAMPMQRKIKRFSLRQAQPMPGLVPVRPLPPSAQPQLDLKAQIIAFASAYTAARKQLAEARKKALVTEYRKLLSVGTANYVPSAEFVQDRVLAAEFQRYVAGKFGTNGCRCEKPGETIPPPLPPKPKFGVVTQKLKCFDQCETGHDEIYLSSVAVDGNGKYVSTVSEKYSIDDDSDDVLYPHHWVYPMQDANGFLDIAIRMMEDDGGYDDISNAFKAAGGVVSTIGSAVANPFVLGAGVAVSILGAVIDIIGDLDDDDDYGMQTRTWGSQATLQSGVGALVLPYTGEDWAGDNFDFDLTLSLGMSA